MKKTCYIIFTVLILFSCSTGINSVLKDYEEVNDNIKINKLTEIIRGRCLCNLKITQRAVITLNNMQYDFIIYTAYQSSDKFRTVFLTDMGNMILDFIYTDGSIKIITNLSNIPENLILNGFCIDFRHIFCSVLSSFVNKTLYHSDGYYSIFYTCKYYKELYIFDNNDILTESIYSQRNRIITRVIFNKDASLLKINNYRYSYYIE
jgi:hypothetical protein